MSFKEFIRKRRKALNLNLVDVADAVGVRTATVSRWESGEISNIKMNRLSALAKVLEVKVSYLMYLIDSDLPTPESNDVPSLTIKEIFGDVDQLELEYETLPSVKSPYARPVLGTVQAGIPITATENIIDYEELDPKQYSNPGEYFGLRIQGDSMEPRICEGDVVIVHQQSQIDSGDIAIVLINGDVATCKKVMHKENGIILSSFNPKYEPMYYSAEEVINLPVTIIGKVVELRGKF